MLSAPVPENDDQRIASLRDMTLLSTPREADFDRVTRLASKLFGTKQRFADWYTGMIGARGSCR
jgi:hypothetical protein